jgi:hypothetical protein
VLRSPALSLARQVIICANVLVPYLRVISTATGILACLRFTYAFEKRSHQ